MAFSTIIGGRKRKSNKSRFAKRIKKMRSKRGRKSWSRKSRGKKDLKSKVRRVLGIFAGIIFVMIFLGVVFALSIVAKYSAELPNPEEPFERGQAQTSYVVDRNGKELYKIHGDQNREIASIDDVPPEVQWAFLAAEDVDFYTHKGVDLGGFVRAGMYEIFKVGSPSGGSTITQQMIKNTVLTNERTYERKIKEIILSLRIEQQYEKKQVLQLYINEIPFGGNTYGIKTAARVYFGKDVKKLTLGEGALLAGLPQSPGLYSPLFASDIKQARELAKVRQNYVLDQLLEKKDTINSYARKHNDLGEDEELITEEIIEKARKQKLKYKSKKVNIDAPHFVFYVEDALQKGKYNDGQPFTLNEIERGGLKITTSLDLDLQRIAEQSLKEGVEGIGKQYGGNNGALVTIDPKTGQILAMVGSKDYFGNQEPKGCTLGKDCKYEPKVNVAISLRQPGSSLKPMVYYTGFEEGELYPASFLPDIPITFDGNYKPKNSGGGFEGAMTLRTALKRSRNIPAVEGLEIVGVPDFLKSLEKFGYTTFTDPQNYGAALALGAGDVKLVEHTNGYGVLARQGMHHPISPVLKIEDSEGNVIYDYKKDESRKGVRVASEQATYLINDILKNYQVTPPPSGYEFAGKTGTSDDNKNVYYMGYSPEVVTGVWVGNNDNTRMASNAYGFTVARPIWIDYMYKIAGRFSPAKFERPGNIVTKSVCSDSGLLATDKCSPISDLFIADKLPKKDKSHKVYRVCKDQPNRLARPIDEELGYAKDKVYRYVKAPKKEWQPFWDRALGQGKPPTEQCTANRSPKKNKKPWVKISKPTNGTEVAIGGQVRVEARAYSSVSDIAKIEVYIGNTYITKASSNPYAANLTVPSGISVGNNNLTIKAYDSEGRMGGSSVTIFVGDVASLTKPKKGATITVGTQTTIEALHKGASNVSSAAAYVTDPNGVVSDLPMSSDGNDRYSVQWAPTDEGTHQIQVRMTLAGGSEIYTSKISVTAVAGGPAPAFVMRYPWVRYDEEE